MDTHSPTVNTKLNIIDASFVQNKLKIETRPKNLDILIINSIGVICFILVVCSFIFKIDLLGAQRLEIAFLKDYVFFNTLHVPLIFLSMVLIPEFRTVVNNTRSMFGTFRNEIVFAFVLMVVLSYYGGVLGRENSLYQNVESVELFLVYNITFILLSAFHGLGQQYGVISILNHSNPRFLNESLNCNIEKVFFKIMPILYFTQLLRFFLKAIDHPYFLKLSILFSVAQICFWVVLAAGLINLLWSDKKTRMRKFFFMLRCLIYPFIGYVPIAGVVAGICHGTENLMLINRLINKTKNANRVRFWMGFGVLAWGFFIIPRYLSIDARWLFIDQRLFFALLTSLDLMHYWLDRNIFRMRNPLNRELIGPMLRAS